jgi:molybdenum cofactor biosynthesis enzyme MoaA
MLAWAHGAGMDMTLIEVMPLGDIEPDRVGVSGVMKPSRPPVSSTRT